MLNSPPASPKNKKTEDSPFKLKKVAELISPEKTKLTVMRTLPFAEFIDDLENLTPYFKENIMACLNLIYSHITQRGAHSQGASTFYYHVGATTLHESAQDIMIGGKKHGVKACGIYHKVKNLLAEITEALLPKNKLDAKQRETLNKAQAEFIAHHNALIVALQKLPVQTKQALKKSQNINIDALKPILMTPKKVIRVRTIHPPPGDNTPKKLTVDATRSKDALQPPSPARAKPRTLLYEAALPTPAAPPTKLMVPPSVIRRQFQKMREAIKVTSTPTIATPLVGEDLLVKAKEVTFKFDSVKTVPSSVNPLLQNGTKTAEDVPQSRSGKLVNI